MEADRLQQQKIEKHSSDLHSPDVSAAEHPWDVLEVKGKSDAANQVQRFLNILCNFAVCPCKM